MPTALRFRRDSGLTIVELLVVIGVISFLIAALALACANMTHRAKFESTRSLIRALESGAEAYQSRLGCYPGHPAVTADTTILCQALCTPLAATEGHAGPGFSRIVSLPPFVELPRTRLSFAPQIHDDWGWPLRYTLPGADHFPNGLSNAGRFDIDASSSEAGELGNWNAHLR
jgi:type II secretory pathway pseudopilin PulG